MNVIPSEARDLLLARYACEKQIQSYVDSLAFGSLLLLAPCGAGARANSARDSK